MAAVGAWLGAVWAGTSAAGAIGAFALRAVVSLAINAAVAKLTAPKGPRPQEIQTELRSSNAKRIRHLGRVRASGAVMFWDWAQVGRRRRLFKLLAVAEGGMNGVLQWYLDEQPVAVDVDGYVTTEPWNKGNVRLRFRKGLEGDEWEGGDWPDLRSAFPGSWTINHRLRGVGTILATFDAVGGKDIAEVYSGGEPQVSALISGDSSYWAVNGSYVEARSPAVQLSDIMANPKYGPVTSDDIDLASLTAAHAACTGQVPTSGGTRPRYLSGISYAMADPLKDVAQRVLDAMGGRAMITPEGKLSVSAGVWTAPTVTIEPRHIVEMEGGGGTERISRVTTLVPTYIAPEVDWQEANADPIEDTAAIARWGEGQPKGIDLLAVAHHGQARHLCKQILAKSNPARSLKVKLRSFGLRLIGEVSVFVQHPRLGATPVPFWIENLSYDGSNVTVELAEAAPGSFDWTAAEDGNPPTPAPQVDRGAVSYAATVTAVTVVSGDGDPYIRVTGTYTDDAGMICLGDYRRSDLASGPWTEMIRETAPAGEFRFRTAPLADLRAYDVRIFVAVAAAILSLDRGPYEGGGYTYVNDIEVVANGTPPSSPVIVSASGAAGSTLTVTFEPDLGANYRRTGLYRAGPAQSFAEATVVAWSFDTSQSVTLTSSIPAAGARYWLRSENASSVASAQVLVGTYPA